MLNLAVASVFHTDPRAAGVDLAKELQDELDGVTADVVVLGVGARHPPKPVVDAFRQTLGSQTQLVGYSSFAEISQGEAVVHSVTALALQSAEHRFETVSIDDATADPFASGKQLAQQLSEKPALVLIFFDGLAINASALLRGVEVILGPDAPVYGGGAGDVGDFSGTFQIHAENVITGGAVAIAIYGSLRIAAVHRSGWQPMGATRRCTRVANGNVMLEVDHQPALDMYRAYLGERVHQMPGIAVEFPVGICGVGKDSRIEDQEIMFLRTVVGVDASQQALVLSGEIQEDSTIRMTATTKEDVLASATEATTAALAQLPQPTLALFFTCMARKIVLGPRYKDELTASMQLLGDVPSFGFYTYGEIAPVEGHSTVHSQVCVTLLVQG